MAIKITLFDGTDWIDEEILFAADLIDTIKAAAIQARSVDYATIFYDSSAQDGCLITHSATTWTNVAGANTRRTVDAGVTWANATTDNSSMEGAVTSKGDTTRAISFKTGASKAMLYSIDSGDTWTAATIGGTTITIFKNASFPTASLAVACGTGGSIFIARSTDGGITWNDASTGPTSETGLITMFDGTTGYAVDSNDNIFKTTDGGVNWSNTGINYDVTGANATGAALAVSATEVLFHLGGTGIAYYDNSAGSIVIKAIPDSAVLNDTDRITTNFVKITNGNVYIGFVYGGNGGIHNVMLYKSVDNGITWETKMFSAPDSNAAGDYRFSATFLSEYDTNKLVLWLQNGTGILINETY